VLSLGDEDLDTPLQGGLREGLTELVGEAACGKTQLAMQLLLQVRVNDSDSLSSDSMPAQSLTRPRLLFCRWLLRAVQCQLPKSKGGLSGSALYLAIEGMFAWHARASSSQSLSASPCADLIRAFAAAVWCTELPISRLRSLADSFKQRHPDVTHDVFAKIYIKSITVSEFAFAAFGRRASPNCTLTASSVPSLSLLFQTPSDLSSVLHGPSLRLSLERGDIKLIVLDSVAALFRAEQVGRDDTMDFSARAQELLSMAGQLKLLSATFHVPVLVVNQVSDFFAGADSNSGSALAVEHTKHSYLHHWSMLSSGHRVVPALGLTWANCVNTRIFLTRKHEFVQGQDSHPCRTC
jgi:RecA/RadA recombinase